MTIACYPNSPLATSYAVPGCEGKLTPERPERLVGPPVGALCLEIGRYEFIRGRVVRVIERSYVWAPEQHNADGTHGYRHYEWSVVEYEPGHRVVVDDRDLIELKVGQRIDVLVPAGTGS